MNETMERIAPIIRDNRERFEQFCFSLSGGELQRPVPASTWIVKDFASHLATLDALFVRYAPVIRAGGQLDMTRDADGSAFDLDAWNDAQVAERRAWPLDLIFDEARANRTELIDALLSLEEADIERNMHFSDPKRGTADFPLKAFLVGWAQHDPIHVADMLRALPDRTADAQLQSWLENGFVKGYQAAMNPGPPAS
jgi:hypothetical protein